MSNAPASVVIPKPLTDIAKQLGLDETSVEPYGWYSGKLSLGLHEQLANRPTAKYIGVTAINPTPFGEGKTVVAIGLAMAIARRKHRSIVTLREPSLAPVFGIKGGGAGGGRSRLLPTTDINLHFTGDLHAVAAANNLLAAMIDNHCQRGLLPALNADGISWRRVIDISDKGLAHIETGLDGVRQAPRRQTGFDLTAASEVMSVLALATGLVDLRQRLGRIVVAHSSGNEFVTAEQVGAVGAMTALLRNALRPNLVQTVEHTPAIVHAGPFANISHGNSSVIADLTALKMADYVVTESGFGSDLGAEKFFNVKCRANGLRPDAEVIVCTVRGLKFYSGRYDVCPGRALPDEMLHEDLDALRCGFCNLQGHLAHLRAYGIPVVVAINQFSSDTKAELDLVKALALESGARRVAHSSAFSEGSEGSLELADAVIDACCCAGQASGFRSLYSLDLSYQEKIETIAKLTYGADGVDFHDGVIEQLTEYSRQGYRNLPVCVAKTQYSLSHDPKRRGRPTGFRLPIREVRLAAGAGFILVLTEGISLMPGLPRQPAAYKVDVNADGVITGLGE